MRITFFFFFSSRRRHTRSLRDWSSDVCSSDLEQQVRETRRPPLRPGTVSGHAHPPRLVPDRVLVLDGYSNAALACVRSLGRAGYTVFVASHRRWPLAAWSRYCAGSCGHAEETLQGFAAARAWAHAHGVRIVLPL